MSARRGPTPFRYISSVVAVTGITCLYHAPVAPTSEAAEKSSLMSSRAKRGICFFANPKKKADSSGKPRPRNDTFGIFRNLFSLWVLVLARMNPHRLKPAQHDRARTLAITGSMGKDE